MGQKLSELIDEVIDMTPEKVIQITRMPPPDDRPWRIGWEAKKWPYVGMRAGETLEKALKAAKLKLGADMLAGADAD